MDFLELLKEAQVHGAKRLVVRKYRLYWFLALLALFFMSVGVVLEIVSRYFERPTYVTRFEEVQDIVAFPSVIICPEVEFPQYKMDSFLNEIKYPPNINFTGAKKILLQLAAFFSADVIYKVEDLDNLRQLLLYNYITVPAAGRRLTASCEETLLKCRWKTRIVNCSKLFTMELTGDGFCCVFNGRSLARELTMFGPHKRVKNDDRWSTDTMGSSSGLMVAINQSQKMVDVDRTYKWIAVQSGQHFVETSINGTPLNPGMEHWIAYSNLGLQIDSAVEYCLLECEMERTLTNCQCVRAVHPRPFRSERCGGRRLKCAYSTFVANDDHSECNCLPTCNADMDVLTNVITTSLRAVPVFDTFYDGLDFKKSSVVKVYVNRRVKTVNSLQTYFGPMELFSQLGGVFNLFFGVSVLTLLELIQLAYYAIKGWRSRKIATPMNRKGLILPNVGTKQKYNNKSKYLRNI